MWSILLSSLCFDRVNAAFLDKLEGQARGSEREPKFESTQEAESQAPLSHLKPDPEQSCSGWTEEAGELRLDL